MTVKHDKVMTETEIIRSLRPAQSRAITTIALYAQGQAKKLITNISQGRVVKRGNKTHTVSKPGDPPNVDTGILRASIYWRLQEKGDNISAFVGSSLKYASYLELGAGLPARPFLKPTVEMVRQYALKVIASSVNGKP